MTPQPTGRHVRRDTLDTVAFDRTFRAPIEDVWAAVTEPARLARWIGTWTGDPSSGRISFLMTAEGEEVEPETYQIRECTPPRRLAVHSASDWGVWDLELDLAETDGTTTLTFTHVVHDPAAIENVGPGWDYYLDRLVAAETGADPAAIDFDDYYPAQSGFYQALSEQMTT